MIKHYVEILYPGIICSDTEEREVSNRDSFTLPKEAFGYRFYDKEYTVLNGEELIGKKKNVSGWHYKGKVYTLSDVKNTFPDKDILIRNIEDNNYKQVVKTFQGQFIPMQKNDVVFD